MDDKQKQNIELLTIEIYKFQAGLTPPIMSDLFEATESSHKRSVKFRDYSLQGTSNMEFDSGKIKNVSNIKKI